MYENGFRYLVNQLDEHSSDVLGRVSNHNSGISWIDVINFAALIFLQSVKSFRFTIYNLQFHAVPERAAVKWHEAKQLPFSSNLSQFTKNTFHKTFHGRKLRAKKNTKQST